MIAATGYSRLVRCDYHIGRKHRLLWYVLGVPAPQRLARKLALVDRSRRRVFEGASPHVNPDKEIVV